MYSSTAAASRRDFSALEMPSTGVMSPTRASARSWMRASRVHRERLRRGVRLVGQSMVMRAMRYIWSEMDSPEVMPKRRQPSRLVVLRRARRWKKGTGDGWEGVGRCGKVERAVGVYRASALISFFGVRREGLLRRGYRSPQSRQRTGICWVHRPRCVCLAVLLEGIGVSDEAELGKLG